MNTKDLPPCDQSVYEHGQSVCLVANVPKDEMETLCQSLSETTGWKIDWHYIAGRAHVKALPPGESAEVIKLREQIETLEAMRPHWAKGYSSDSMAAQGQTSALSQAWSALGVKDQTACMEKLRSLLK